MMSYFACMTLWLTSVPSFNGISQFFNLFHTFYILKKNSQFYNCKWFEFSTNGPPKVRKKCVFENFGVANLRLTKPDASLQNFLCSCFSCRNKTNAQFFSQQKITRSMTWNTFFLVDVAHSSEMLSNNQTTVKKMTRAQPSTHKKHGKSHRNNPHTFLDQQETRCSVVLLFSYQFFFVVSGF